MAHAEYFDIDLGLGSMFASDAGTALLEPGQGESPATGGWSENPVCDVDDDMDDDEAYFLDDEEDEDDDFSDDYDDDEYEEEDFDSDSEDDYDDDDL